jgi:hypothetical protein
MVGIWQGECPNVISLSSDNNQITFMCGDDTIQPKTLCEGTSVNCQNDMCAVCCQPLKPPVPPSCPSGSEEVWTGDCDFIQSDCNNNSCTVSCGGNQVYSGNCENIQTSCNNSACVACCTAGGNVPMPTCVGTEVWRTQDPSSCANINSSCQNGTCTIMCNGNVVYTDNSGYNTISTACNTAGCVACVD